MNFSEELSFTRLVEDALCILELAYNEDNREKRIAILTTAMKAILEAKRVALRKEKRSAKALLVALAIASALSAPARAFNTSKNPDVSPSIGWGVHGGRLAGILQNDATYTEWAMDARLPVTNCLTLTVDFAQATVSNAAPGVSTDSNRIGASVRVYLRDFLGD